MIHRYTYTLTVLYDNDTQLHTHCVIWLWYRLYTGGRDDETIVKIVLFLFLIFPFILPVHTHKMLALTIVTYYNIHFQGSHFNSKIKFYFYIF